MVVRAPDPPGDGIPRLWRRKPVRNRFVRPAAAARAPGRPVPETAVVGLRTGPFPSGFQPDSAPRSRGDASRRAPADRPRRASPTTCRPRGAFSWAAPSRLRSLPARATGQCSALPAQETEGGTAVSPES
jgi:hypothetical protein